MTPVGNRIKQNHVCLAFSQAAEVPLFCLFSIDCWTSNSLFPGQKNMACNFAVPFHVKVKQSILQISILHTGHQQHIEDNDYLITDFGHEFLKWINLCPHITSKLNCEYATHRANFRLMQLYENFNSTMHQHVVQSLNLSVQFNQEVFFTN